MITIQIDEKPDPNWNSRLLKSGLGNHNQTIERGIHFERQGQIPQYLKFLDSKGQIVGQLLFSKSARFKKNDLKSNIFKKTPFLKKILYFWIYGPIIFDSEKTSEIYLTLENFLISQNCRYFGSTFPLIDHNVSLTLTKSQTKKWGTYLIDLKKPSNELYENIKKHSGRKNIERALKKNVIVEEINKNSLHEYQKLANRFKEKRGEEVNSNFQNILDWWNLLEPIGRSGFLAKKDNIPISGLLFYHFNRIIVEGGVARSNQDSSEKLYSQDLIKWKIIEWGSKNNMNYYDLAGFNPNPQTKKEEGIKNYKSKWGGTQYDYWFITN